MIHNNIAYIGALILFLGWSALPLSAQPTAVSAAVTPVGHRWISASPPGQAFFQTRRLYEPWVAGRYAGHLWPLSPSAPSILLRHRNALPQPFFCKIEDQLSRKMATSFKFRLGSVEYNDWLEGYRGRPGLGF